MKTRVAVLRGGPSSEYEVSLKTGQSVLSVLAEKYIVSDILIDKEGVWHLDGIPITPESLAQRVDVIFNALHGEYGEDGVIQRILEKIKVPFTGSGSLASAIGMNKPLTKSIFKQHGIKTPHHTEVSKGELTDLKLLEIFRSFPFPNVIKPASSGSSFGVSIVKSFNDLKPALEKAFEYSSIAIIEEYIPGKEATCAVINNFRGEELYALLPIEIRKSSNKELFDYEDKYTGLAEEICPGNFSQPEKELLMKTSRDIHKALGLRHYSRSDFIVHPRRGIYALEVNTLPGLTAESLLPKSLAAVGCTLPEFLDHLVSQSLIK